MIINTQATVNLTAVLLGPKRSSAFSVVERFVIESCVMLPNELLSRSRQRVNSDEAGEQRISQNQSEQKPRRLSAPAAGSTLGLSYL